MAWLCNDQQQKGLFRHCCWCVWALAERMYLPAELLAHKGASQGQSPGAGRCTWLPLGVLATFLWQGTKGNSDTQTTDGLCCLSPIHDASVALGYTSLWADRRNRARNGHKGQRWSCPLQRATLLSTLASIISVTLCCISLLVHW